MPIIIVFIVAGLFFGFGKFITGVICFASGLVLLSFIATIYNALRTGRR